MEEAQERIKQCILNNSTELYLNELELTELPDNLPSNLTILDCSFNKVEKIDNLPSNLTNLDCSNNKYLHITKKLAQKFRLKETPNYFKYALKIQKVYRKYISKKRLNKMYKLYDSDIFHIKDIIKIIVNY